MICSLLVVGGLILWFFKWKRDSDRAGCIMNIRNVQQGMRSYMGMNGHVPQADVPGFSLDTLIGQGAFLDAEPRCPSGGTYTWIEGVHPPVGVLMLRCSHPDHVPANHSDW